jgi:hypothetical protein
LDGANPSLAALTFGDAGSYTIAQGSGGTLQLANGTAGATLTVAAGAQTISAPLVFGSNVTISVPTGSTLTVTGPVTGNGYSLTVAGGGTVYFNSLGSNTIGNTTVTSGKLVIKGASALTSGGNLTVGDAAVFAAAAPSVGASVAAAPVSKAALAVPSSTSVAPASIAAVVSTPKASSLRGLAFSASSFVGPVLSPRLRPALQAAAAVLAQQGSTLSNIDKPSPLRAVDAVFAGYSR